MSSDGDGGLRMLQCVKKGMNEMISNKTRAVSLAVLMVVGMSAGCLSDDGTLTADDGVAENPVDSLVIAFEVKDTYTNIDDNPQRLADYLAEKLNAPVSLYPVDSEGATMEALRFGNADIGFMDGGAAWIGWQQYDLGVLASETKPDGRTWYGARAVVMADSDIAAADLDNSEL